MNKQSGKNKKELQNTNMIGSDSIKKKSFVCLISSHEESTKGQVFYDVFTEFDLQKILANKIFSRN